MRVLEDGFGGTVAKVESGLVSLSAFQAQHPHGMGNGNAKINGGGGLVTPPSPRSLSAESTRPRQRRKRASGSRGRARSNSASSSQPTPSRRVNEQEWQSREDEHEHDGASEDSCFDSSDTRRRSPWATDDSDDSESFGVVVKKRPSLDSISPLTQGIQFPITPESSLLHQPINHRPSISGAVTESRTKDPPKEFVSLSCYSFRTVTDTNLATATLQSSINSCWHCSTWCSHGSGGVAGETRRSDLTRAVRKVRRKGFRSGRYHHTATVFTPFYYVVIAGYFYHLFVFAVVRSMSLSHQLSCIYRASLFAPCACAVLYFSPLRCMQTSISYTGSNT